MQTDLGSLLREAKGQSRHVVVVFLDVRGFTSFAKIAESTDAAEFLRTAYLRILDDFVPDATFVKLTGDGMLVLYEYDRDSLTSTVRKAMDIALRLVETFPTLTDGDSMLNFEVPQELGVGLARGAATEIRSGDTVLDYSGRPLNLAARLMDLARPSGVVLDATFGLELLDDSTKKLFSEEQLYVRSVAEDESIPVYVMPERTTVPERNRFPLNKFARVVDPGEVLPFSELCERGSVFQHTLNRPPVRTDDIKVNLSYPKTKPDGSAHPTMRRMPSYKAGFLEAQGKNLAIVDYAEIVRYMREVDKTNEDWKVEIAIEYSVHENPN